MKKHSIVLTLLFLFCLFGCDEPFISPEIQAPIENGYGRISISFAAGEAVAPQQARTTFPQPVFDRYVYTFTKTGEETGAVKAPDTDGFFTLEVGNYTVEVQAYTGDAEPYTLAASGVSSEFIVGPGENDPVEVILTLVADEGQGKFRYSITYPAGATAEITLQKWPDMEEVTLTPANLAAGNGVTETLELEAGSYLLSVLVSSGSLNAGTNEAVHIYPSLATVYTKDFVISDGNIIIRKLPGAAAGIPTLNYFTQDSVTINPVDPPGNGQTVEYGINTSNTAPSAWQTGLTFSGLSEGVYYIFARSAENYDYTAGAANGSLLVPVIVVTNTGHWNAALTAIRNGGSGTAENPKTYTIVVSGDIAVSGSAAVGNSLGSVTYIDVTLKGSGTLSLSSNGSILYLGANQKLIIDDANMTLQGRGDNNAAVVYVGSGVLELKNGVIRSNRNFSSSSSSYGGGVYVGGTFTKTGGTIYGYNDGDNNSNTVISSSGGVLSNRGHAVYVTWSSTTKRKETTAGPGVNLAFNGSNGTFSGAWDY